MGCRTVRSGVPYSGGQPALQLPFLSATAVETVGAELLPQGIDAPEGLRRVVLAGDLYSLLTVVACVTRPHVLPDGGLRIRYGAFFDLRVPRERIGSLRVARSFNESGLVGVEDEWLSVAVAAQTNVVMEPNEPGTAVRPPGGRAEVRTIRFFADGPELLIPAGT